MQKVKNRGIYLLPNLLTTAGLFAGFYAIVAAMQGKFEIAAVAIIIAGIADMLDGRIARWTNTQTAFGVQYDSIADVVSFAIAPALVVYSWALFSLGKVGWLSAFIFVVCGALRLARFNAQADTDDKRYFQGLPTPSAAGLIATMVWMGNEYNIFAPNVAIIVAIITVIISVLMVSNNRYYSFKGYGIKGKVSFISIAVIILLLVVISLNPAETLFILAVLYVLSGPAYTLWMVYQKRSKRRWRKKQQARKNSDV